MGITVAVMAQGTMGAGVGKRLHERGAEVRTLLSGRSEASAERARSRRYAAGGRRARIAVRAPISFCRSCRPTRPRRWPRAWRRRCNRWRESRSMSIATRSARKPPRGSPRLSSRPAPPLSMAGSSAARRARATARRSTPRGRRPSAPRRSRITASTGASSTGRSARRRGSRCPMPGSPRERPRSPRRCCWVRPDLGVRKR